MLSRRSFLNSTLGSCAGLALTAQGVGRAAAQPSQANAQPAQRRIIVDSQVHLWLPQTPGAFAAWQTGNWGWLAGGLMMLANWPFTIFVIMPTNNSLMAMEAATPEVRSLITKWGQLHAVRSALGIAAVLIFLTSSLWQ